MFTKFIIMVASKEAGNGNRDEDSVKFKFLNN